MARSLKLESAPWCKPPGSCRTVRVKLSSQAIRPCRALLLRVAQQEIHTRRALRLDEDLVREERLAQTDEREIQRHRDPAEETVAQHLGKGRRHTAHLHDPEARIA